jgi:hypothetical protein
MLLVDFIHFQWTIVVAKGRVVNVKATVRDDDVLKGKK